MKKNVLERARARLVIVFPFFGTILLRHPMRATENVPTAAINLKGEIMYNPAFCEKLSMQQALFVLAHVTLHIAFAHLARRGDRDPKVWNIANDAIINEIIRKEMTCDAAFIDGYVEIPGASEFSSEQLYEKLVKDAKRTPRGGTNYSLNMDDLCHDDGERPPTPEEVKQIILEAKEEVAAAATSSNMSGGLSATMEKMVADFINSKVPWYQALECFFTRYATQRQSWSHPNKRYRRVAYLPRRNRMPSLGHVAIGVDTSGSICYEELQQYFGHLNALFDQCHPSAVTVVYCNCEVLQTEDFTPDEFPIVAREVYGGGGTDMRKVVEWAQENSEAEAIIIFTDGFTPIPKEKDVRLPLVWVCSTDELEQHNDVPGLVITQVMK